MNTQLLYGVYRAVIIDTNDPMGKGRIKVCPPSTLGEEMAVWAPAVISEPLNSAKVGDTVLVAFERGNTHYPIVLGLIAFGEDQGTTPDQ